MDKQHEQATIRILIVDDHPVVRAGLATLLRSQRDLQIEGAVNSAEEALAFLENKPVDVVLLDLRMPKTTGLEALPQIVGRAHSPRVLILSSFDYEEEIYRSAMAGASGYLMKSAPRAEILKAIRAVASGGMHFPHGIANRILERKGRPGLSPREQDILLMISKGLTNKEIGHALLISQYTVRNHVNHILEKLEASDRTEAVAIAIQQGVIAIHT